MPEIDTVLDNWGHAKDDLLAAENAATVELIAAKEAYRSNPNLGRLRRKQAAVATIQRIRAAKRQGRTGNLVAGDAVRGN